MRVKFGKATIVELIALTAGVLFVAMLVQLGARTPTAHAQADNTICRAAMVLDRSGSVGEFNLVTMRNQIRRLFQPTGLYDANIHLAFWSFSGNDLFVFPGTPAQSNYDAPFNGYVSSRGEDSNFNTRLNQVQSAGYTNYEQGFGYDGGVMNTRDGIDQIINQTNIIVFMTDGQPNEPGGEANARTVARAAVVKHLAAGRVVIGGLVGGIGANNLNFVINGNDNNATNTFRISDNYNDLAAQLRTQIGTKCNELNPPCPYNPDIRANDPDCKPPEAAPYSLTPTVIATNTVISGTDSAGFNYKVDNNGVVGTSEWSVKRLVVDRGQTVDPLYYTNTEPFRDDYSCAKLLALVGGRATCDDSGAGGTRSFAPGQTTLTANEIGPANSTTVDDSWQVGTKLCYVFTITKPTQKDTPTNRYSRAACVVVGKRPTVQIHGGDVTVGRYFKSGDVGSGALPSIKGSVTSKSGSVNKTFGSWAEYGVFAPGVVSGFASASGLSEGYPGSVASNQDLWSRLTFANTFNQFGNFTSAAGLGPVTNVADYFLHGRSVAKDLSTVDAVSVSGGGVTTGLYEKADGNLKIDASVLEKGKMVIIHVPRGTATITGNLSYIDGPYQSMSEIPQLIIIAKNIVINSNVSNVDAWLLAQDDEGNGGTIATCEQPAPLNSEMCNGLLTVNGPVMAKELQLRRTGGSGIGAASKDPAEVFNLRADAYLWSYNEGRSAVRAQTTFTTELPPQF